MKFCDARWLLLSEQTPGSAGGSSGLVPISVDQSARMLALVSIALWVGVLFSGLSIGFFAVND